MFAAKNNTRTDKQRNKNHKNHHHRHTHCFGFWAPGLTVTGHSAGRCEWRSTDTPCSLQRPTGSRWALSGWRRLIGQGEVDMARPAVAHNGLWFLSVAESEAGGTARLVPAMGEWWILPILTEAKSRSEENFRH